MASLSTSIFWRTKQREVELSAFGQAMTRYVASYLMVTAKDSVGTEKRYGGGIEVSSLDGQIDLRTYSYSKLHSRTIHIRPSEHFKTGAIGLRDTVLSRWEQLVAQLGAFFEVDYGDHYG